MKFSPEETKRKFTKRQVASIAFRIFDPLGFLSPFTIRAKILLQQLWVRGTDWDEEMPPDSLKSWSTWLQEIDKINEIRIPRKLISNKPTVEEIELHMFSDDLAFATVGYLRVIRKDGTISTSFVTSKTRVAPLKKMQIPRLELTACLLSARLAKTIKEELKLDEKVNVWFWTDSEIALHWIKGAATKFKQFVANRINEIQELTDPKYWQHCAGTENPADKPSRGLKMENLISDQIWWGGPLWLKEPKENWPKPKLKNRKEKVDEDLELSKN